MKAITTRCLAFAIVASTSLALSASEGTVHKGIYYGPEDATEYQKEICKLDIYLPSDTSKAVPVLVFFHGGGLTGGSRGGPNLTTEGIARIIHEFVGRTEQTPFVPELRSLF